MRMPRKASYRRQFISCVFKEEHFYDVEVRILPAQRAEGGRSAGTEKQEGQLDCTVDYRKRSDV